MEQYRAPQVVVKNVRRGLSCWSLFFALSTLSAVPALAAGKNYAFLVGVGDYEQWGRLVNPVPDVLALGDELGGHYGFVSEVLEHPERTEIIARIRTYMQLDYGPEDQLVIVFAGHGNYDEITGIGYLAAKDSASRNRDPNFTSLISYPLLLALVDNIPCPKILLIVDACYSGALAGARRQFEGQAAGATRVRRFLTSGGIGYVSDGGPGDHTPFVRRLLEGLRSRNVGSTLTLTELERDFMSRVADKPRSGAFGSDSGKGRFSFVARKGQVTRRASAAARPATAAATRARAASRGPSPSVPESLLRSRPQRLAASEVKQAFRRKGLFDATRSPEGDFANEYRQQVRDGWDVLEDLGAGLMWQQSGSDRRMSHGEAEAYIRSLNRERHAGFSGWRLPTVEELGSLLEPYQQSNGLHLYPFFDSEQETCWSADRDSQTGEAFYVSFNAGLTMLSYGKKTAFVRAVRSSRSRT